MSSSALTILDNRADDDFNIEPQHPLIGNNYQAEIPLLSGSDQFSSYPTAEAVKRRGHIFPPDETLVGKRSSKRVLISSITGQSAVYLANDGHNDPSTLDGFSLLKGRAQKADSLQQSSPEEMDINSDNMMDNASDIPTYEPYTPIYLASQSMVSEESVDQFLAEAFRCVYPYRDEFLSPEAHYWRNALNPFDTYSPMYAEDDADENGEGSGDMNAHDDDNQDREDDSDGFSLVDADPEAQDESGGKLADLDENGITTQTTAVGGVTARRRGSTDTKHPWLQQSESAHHRPHTQQRDEKLLFPQTAFDGLTLTASVEPLPNTLAMSVYPPYNRLYNLSPSPHDGLMIGDEVSGAAGVAVADRRGEAIAASPSPSPSLGPRRRTRKPQPVNGTTDASSIQPQYQPNTVAAAAAVINTITATTTSTSMTADDPSIPPVDPQIDTTQSPNLVVMSPLHTRLKPKLYSRKQLLLDYPSLLRNVLLKVYRQHPATMSRFLTASDFTTILSSVDVSIELTSGQLSSMIDLISTESLPPELSIRRSGSGNRDGKSSVNSNGTMQQHRHHPDTSITNTTQQPPSQHAFRREARFIDILSQTTPLLTNHYSHTLHDPGLTLYPVNPVTVVELEAVATDGLMRALPEEIYNHPRVPLPPSDDSAYLSTTTSAAMTSSSADGQNYPSTEPLRDVDNYSTLTGVAFDEFYTPSTCLTEEHHPKVLITLSDNPFPSNVLPVDCNLLQVITTAQLDNKFGEGDDDVTNSMDDDSGSDGNHANLPHDHDEPRTRSKSTDFNPHHDHGGAQDQPSRQLRRTRARTQFEDNQLVKIENGPISSSDCDRDEGVDADADEDDEDEDDDDDDDDDSNDKNHQLLLNPAKLFLHDEYIHQILSISQPKSFTLESLLFYMAQPTRTLPLLSFLQAKQFDMKDAITTILPNSKVVDDISENCCFVCNTQGFLIICEYSQCRKVFHVQCIGLTQEPQGTWYCPRHFCTHCSQQLRNTNLATHVEGHLQSQLHSQSQSQSIAGYQCDTCPVSYCLDCFQTHSSQPPMVTKLTSDDVGLWTSLGMVNQTANKFTCTNCLSKQDYVAGQQPPLAGVTATTDTVPVPQPNLSGGGESPSTIKVDPSISISLSTPAVTTPTAVGTSLSTVEAASIPHAESSHSGGGSDKLTEQAHTTALTGTTAHDDDVQQDYSHKAESISDGIVPHVVLAHPQLAQQHSGGGGSTAEETLRDVIRSKQYAATADALRKQCLIDVYSVLGLPISQYELLLAIGFLSKHNNPTLSAAISDRQSIAMKPMTQTGQYAQQSSLSSDGSAARALLAFVQDFIHTDATLGEPYPLFTAQPPVQMTPMLATAEGGGGQPTTTYPIQPPLKPPLTVTQQHRLYLYINERTAFQVYSSFKQQFERQYTGYQHFVAQVHTLRSHWGSTQETLRSSSKAFADYIVDINLIKAEFAQVRLNHARNVTLFGSKCKQRVDALCEAVDSLTRDQRSIDSQRAKLESVKTGYAIHGPRVNRQQFYNRPEFDFITVDDSREGGYHRSSTENNDMSSDSSSPESESANDDPGTISIGTNSNDGHAFHLGGGSSDDMATSQLEERFELGSLLSTIPQSDLSAATRLIPHINKQIHTRLKTTLQVGFQVESQMVLDNANTIENYIDYLGFVAGQYSSLCTSYLDEHMPLLFEAIDDVLVECSLLFNYIAKRYQVFSSLYDIQQQIHRVQREMIRCAEDGGSANDKENYISTSSAANTHIAIKEEISQHSSGSPSSTTVAATGMGSPSHNLQHLQSTLDDFLTHRRVHQFKFHRLTMHELSQYDFFYYSLQNALERHQQCLRSVERTTSMPWTGNTSTYTWVPSPPPPAPALALQQTSSQAHVASSLAQPLLSSSRSTSTTLPSHGDVIVPSNTMDDGGPSFSSPRQADQPSGAALPAEPLLSRSSRSSAPQPSNLVLNPSNTNVLPAQPNPTDFTNPEQLSERLLHIASKLGIILSSDSVPSESSSSSSPPPALLPALPQSMQPFLDALRDPISRSLFAHDLYEITPSSQSQTDLAAAGLIPVVSKSRLLSTAIELSHQFYGLLCPFMSPGEAGRRASLLPDSAIVVLPRVRDALIEYYKTIDQNYVPPSKPGASLRKWRSETTPSTSSDITDGDGGGGDLSTSLHTTTVYSKLTGDDDLSGLLSTAELATLNQREQLLLEFFYQLFQQDCDRFHATPSDPESLMITLLIASDPSYERLWDQLLFPSSVSLLASPSSTSSEASPSETSSSHTSTASDTSAAGDLLPLAFSSLFPMSVPPSILAQESQFEGPSVTKPRIPYSAASIISVSSIIPSGGGSSSMHPNLVPPIDYRSVIPDVPRIMTSHEKQIYLLYQHTLVLMEEQEELCHKHYTVLAGLLLLASVVERFGQELNASYDTLKQFYQGTYDQVIRLEYNLQLHRGLVHQAADQLTDMMTKINSAASALLPILRPHRYQSLGPLIPPDDMLFHCTSPSPPPPPQQGQQQQQQQRQEGNKKAQDRPRPAVLNMPTTTPLETTTAIPDALGLLALDSIPFTLEASSLLSGPQQSDDQDGVQDAIGMGIGDGDNSTMDISDDDDGDDDNGEGYGTNDSDDNESDGSRDDSLSPSPMVDDDGRPIQSEPPVLVSPSLAYIHSSTKTLSLTSILYDDLSHSLKYIPRKISHVQTVVGQDADPSDADSDTGADSDSSGSMTDTDEEGVDKDDVDNSRDTGKDQTEDHVKEQVKDQGEDDPTTLVKKDGETSCQSRPTTTPPPPPTTTTPTDDEEEEESDDIPTITEVEYYQSPVRYGHLDCIRLDGMCLVHLSTQAEVVSTIFALLSRYNDLNDMFSSNQWYFIAFLQRIHRDLLYPEYHDYNDEVEPTESIDFQILPKQMLHSSSLFQNISGYSPDGFSDTPASRLLSALIAPTTFSSYDTAFPVGEGHLTLSHLGLYNIPIDWFALSNALPTPHCALDHPHAAVFDPPISSSQRVVKKPRIADGSTFSIHDETGNPLVKLDPANPAMSTFHASNGGDSLRPSRPGRKSSAPRSPKRALPG